jgi:hypothetical protein
MVVAMRTMHMSVLNFFLNGSTHVRDIQLEAQSLTGPRMVAIQHHRITFDFHHIENSFTTIGCSPPKLTTHFDTWRKIFLGHGLQQAFVALTK